MAVANSPASLFFVSPSQVNFQVPWISITQPVQAPLRIFQPQGFTTITVTITPYAPALF